jgi:hypothetical protein
MDYTNFKNQHPEIHKAVFDEAFKAGKMKERERIGAWMLQITPINTQFIKAGILSENVAPDPLKEMEEFNVKLDQLLKKDW